MMKHWSSIRKFFVLQISKPAVLSAEPDGPTTHIALPLGLDRGRAVLVLEIGQARVLAATLANCMLAAAERTCKQEDTGEVAGDEVAMLESIQVPEEETRGDTE